MNVVIIKYNAGNIRSVKFALQRLGIDAVISADHEVIKAADKVIFPGVGEASTTMDYLRESGMAELIPQLKQPVLGICLGMQLMCKHSEEGDTNCLGIFDVNVKRFVARSGEQNITKIPHMGWNTLTDLRHDFIPKELNNEFVYFVHSFYAELSEFTAATTNYIQPYSSVLRKDNFYATQFHPEKSGPVGAAILKAFIEK